MRAAWIAAFAIVTNVSTASQTGAPTLEELGNLAYVGLEAGRVELRGGKWEGPPFVPDGASRPRVRLVNGLYAIGDLDAGNGDEAAVLLTKDAGSSATTVSIAIVGRRDGAWRNIATRAIGDRVQVRTLAIAARQIVMRVVAHSDDDPICCPTVKRRLVFALEGDQLIERDVQTEGRVSLADLERTTWRLVSAGWRGRAASATRQTAHFADGRISGSAGCNRFTGSIALRDSRLQIGTLAGTRMACEPAVEAAEQRYYAALAAASSFGFSFGRLAIGFESPDGPDTLLFELER